MRQNNKYLAKVWDELDIYQQHMIDGRELTEMQEKNFQKLDIIRGWILSGQSDINVIKLAKNDPRLKLQDRRARELLSMAYEIFAELRHNRNRDGLKFMYAEIMRTAAEKVYADYKKLFASGADYRGAAALFREYKNMLKEAAVIDGAYDTSKAPDDSKKKPTKMVFKRKTIVKDGNVQSDQVIEEATYEIDN